MEREDKRREETDAGGRGKRKETCSDTVLARPTQEGIKVAKRKKRKRTEVRKQES